MPIYEYECSDCGHRLEAIQKLADAPLSDCPSCHSSGLKKLISAVGFRLSGGGWYETDFKSSNKRNLSEGDSSKSKESKDSKKPSEASAASSTSSTSSSSTTDSKPSTKISTSGA